MVNVFVALMVSVPDSPETRSSNMTFHSPAAFALAERILPEKVTVTSSPGSARPHTGAGAPAWSIMWSEKKAGTDTSALRSQANPNSQAMMNAPLTQPLSWKFMSGNRAPHNLAETRSATLFSSAISVAVKS